jgi:hypothetical protein
MLCVSREFHRVEVVVGATAGRAQRHENPCISKCYDAMKMIELPWLDLCRQLFPADAGILRGRQWRFGLN